MSVIPLPRALLAACLAALLPACTEAGADTRDADAPARSTPASMPAPEATAVAPALPAPDTAREAAPACPEGMVQIERVCIDRYEAHLVARGPGGEVTPHPHFQRPEEGVTYEARSDPGVFPQAYISRVESESACASAGKRLCSRSEWLRACKGALGTTYPYGQRWQPGRCNAEKPHLLTLRFGPDPRRWAYAQFNDPGLDQEPGFLARTGEYEECSSDAGVQDLVGNLHEWVSDTADPTLKARLDTEGIPRAFQYWSPGNAVFMGGFYSTHGELGPGCTFTTIAHEPRYHDYSTGFRCCKGAGG